MTEVSKALSAFTEKHEYNDTLYTRDMVLLFCDEFLRDELRETAEAFTTSLNVFSNDLKREREVNIQLRERLDKAKSLAAILIPAPGQKTVMNRLKTQLGVSVAAKK